MRAALIVHNNPELFAEQIAGIVIVFALVKLNQGFTIGEPEHFKALPKNDNTSAIADRVKTTGHNNQEGSLWYFGEGQNILPLQN